MQQQNGYVGSTEKHQLVVAMVIARHGTHDSEAKTASSNLQFDAPGRTGMGVQSDPTGFASAGKLLAPPIGLNSEFNA